MKTVRERRYSRLACASCRPSRALTNFNQSQRLGNCRKLTSGTPNVERQELGCGRLVAAHKSRARESRRPISQTWGARTRGESASFHRSILRSEPARDSARFESFDRRGTSSSAPSFTSAAASSRIDLHNGTQWHDKKRGAYF